MVAGFSPEVKDLLQSSVAIDTGIELVDFTESVLDALVVMDPGVDVLLMPESSPGVMPPICSHLLSEFPALRILVLEPSLREANAYWLGIKESLRLSVTQSALSQTIRYACELD
jgi:hypothetical protein